MQKKFLSLVFIFSLTIVHPGWAYICPTRIIKITQKGYNWYIPPGWEGLRTEGGVTADKSTTYVLQVTLDTDDQHYNEGQRDSGMASVICYYITYFATSFPTGQLEIRRFIKKPVKFKPEQGHWYQGLSSHTLSCEVDWKNVTLHLKTVSQCSWSQSRPYSNGFFMRVYLVTIMDALAHAVY